MSRGACKHCRNGWFDPKGGEGSFYFGEDVECVNGVLIDIDEAHEGHDPSVVRNVAPCHPMWARQLAGDEDFPNDSRERLGAWASNEDARTALATAPGEGK